jgi:hypothetical protein
LLVIADLPRRGHPGHALTLVRATCSVLYSQSLFWAVKKNWLKDWSYSLGQTHMRNLIARGYIYALPIVIAGAALWFYYSPRAREDFTVVITIIGGIISFIYVVQKQQLEDLQTFKELFNDFNIRYDKLNEKLNRIAIKKADTPLTEDETDTLYDYFNLCAEEYLYFKEGFIYKEVWTAWCYGIRFFFDQPRIRPLWQQEEETHSYYGLTLQIVRNGSPTSKKHSQNCPS